MPFTIFFLYCSGNVQGLGTDEQALVEIMMTRTNEQIKELKAAYPNGSRIMCFWNKIILLWYIEARHNFTKFFTSNFEYFGPVVKVSELVVWHWVIIKQTERKTVLCCFLCIVNITAYSQQSSSIKILYY